MTEGTKIQQFVGEGRLITDPDFSLNLVDDVTVDIQLRGSLRKVFRSLGSSVSEDTVYLTLTLALHDSVTGQLKDYTIQSQIGKKFINNPADFLRGMFASALQHELDECFIVNGEFINGAKPHGITWAEMLKEAE